MVSCLLYLGYSGLDPFEPFVVLLLGKVEWFVLVGQGCFLVLFRSGAAVALNQVSVLASLVASRFVQQVGVLGECRHGGIDKDHHGEPHVLRIHILAVGDLVRVFFLAGHVPDPVGEFW